MVSGFSNVMSCVCVCVCVCVYYGVSERRESIVLRKNWSLESGWLLSASPRAAVQVPFKSICTTCMCTQPSVHNPVTPMHCFYYSSLVLVYLWSSGEFPIFHYVPHVSASLNSRHAAHSG